MLVVFGIILLIILIKVKKGQRFPPFLIFTLVFSMISTIVYLIYYLTPPDMKNVQTIMYFHASMLLLIAFFYLYLHYESLISERHMFFRFLVIFGVFIFNLSLHFIIFLNLYRDLNSFEFMIDLISTIFGAMIIMFSLNVVHNTYKVIKERAILIELLTLLLLALSGILYLTGFIFIYDFLPNSNDIGTQILNISNMIIIGCLILLVVNYTIHSDYIFRIPFPINQIMIINQKGTIVYSRQTSIQLIPEMDPEKELILSGYIRVISDVIETILGSDFQNNKIESGEYRIYFSQIRNKKGIVVLISRGGNYLLQKSIDHFKKELSDMILDRFQHLSRLEDSEINELDSLLKHSFPYLEIKK